MIRVAPSLLAESDHCCLLARSGVEVIVDFSVCFLVFRLCLSGYGPDVLFYQSIDMQFPCMVHFYFYFEIRVQRVITMRDPVRVGS